jgi:hypothetical protein
MISTKSDFIAPRLVFLVGVVLLLSSCLQEQPLGIEGSGGCMSNCGPGTSGSFAMTTARASHTATLLSDGRVLIAGGFSAGGASLASAELYDPSSGTFTATGNMTAARGAHTAVSLANGSVLVAGGRTSRVLGTDVTSAELYDPSTGVFTAIGSLIGNCCYAWDGSTSALLSDGRVLIATENNAEIYDPATGTFALAGAYDTPVYAIYATTLLADGRVLFTASFDFASNNETDELFDPKTDTFTPTGTRINATIITTATLLTNGTVLFVEGLGPVAGPNTEIYDPVAGSFTQAGQTLNDHTGGTATRLADGRVLIAGGQSPNVTTPSGSPGIELYLPATGTFAPAGSLSTGRYDHTATLLADGTVLIAGGYPSWDQPTANAEIYR